MMTIGKIKVKAIFLGCLVDLAGSLLMGTVLGIIWGVGLVIQGVSSQEIQNYPFTLNLIVLIMSMIFGFGATFLGGYVAGRISKESQILHGGVVGALAIIWGVIFLSQVPVWFKIISFIGVIPMGILGGYLAKGKTKQLNA